MRGENVREQARSVLLACCDFLEILRLFVVHRHEVYLRIHLATGTHDSMKYFWLS